MCQKPVPLPDAIGESGQLRKEGAVGGHAGADDGCAGVNIGPDVALGERNFAV